MSRLDRVRLYVLIAPALATIGWLALLYGALWLVDYSPPLSSLLEAGVFFFVCAQVAVVIWYLRIRNDL